MMLNFIKYCIIFELGFFAGCTHKSDEERVIDFVVDEQERLYGGVSGYTNEFIIKKIFKEEWLTKDVYIVEMPNMYHNPNFITAVDNESVTTVDNLMETVEYDKSNLINNEKFIELNDFNKFYEYYSEVYYNILFNQSNVILEDPGLPDSLNYSFSPPLIIKERDKVFMTFDVAAYSLIDKLFIFRDTVFTDKTNFIVKRQNIVGGKLEIL